MKTICYDVVNVISSCYLLLDARPTSPSLLDNTGHPAHDHQMQVTKTKKILQTKTSNKKYLRLKRSKRLEQRADTQERTALAKKYILL